MNTLRKMGKMIEAPILNRSGFASIVDFQNAEFQKVYTFLEEKQKQIIFHLENIRSAEYKWALDPLHWWSRVWEYPYVYVNLLYLRKLFTKKSIRILDFGSGVTFFPFLLNETGFDVVCVDNDPVCVEGIKKANQFFQTAQSTTSVVAVLSQNYSIPIDAKKFDIIYSVSVLEHIPQPILIIRELRRLLTDGGFLVLTFDVCERGNAEIVPEKYRALMSSLRKAFDIYLPEETIHPSEVLSSMNSQYPMKEDRSFRTLAYFIKLFLRDIAAHRTPKPYFQKTILKVQGLVLKAKPYHL